MRIARDRRQLVEGLASAAGVFLFGCAAALQQPRAARGVQPITSKQEPEKDNAPTPAEDLMREHGLIDRVLIIYDEVALHLERRGTADTGPAARAAQIVERFVEANHEKLEEALCFPGCKTIRDTGRSSRLSSISTRRGERSRATSSAGARREVRGRRAFAVRRAGLRRAAGRGGEHRERARHRRTL